MLQLDERSPLLLEGLALVFMRDADLHQLPVEVRDLLLPRLERGPRLFERGTLPLELAHRLLARHPLLFEHGRASTSATHSRWRWPSASWRAALSCRSCSFVVVSATVFFARAVFSPSASWSAARPCWSWARVLTTSASNDNARERAPSKSTQARRSASSRSTNTVRTLTTAEAPSAAWAPCSEGESNRASTRASRASYCPRYQRKSASGRSKVMNRSRARRSSSCHQQAEQEGRASEKNQTKKKQGKRLRNSTEPN
jgi:hypothetical protein